jgi:predicted SprT family Zn-dependent metalloprotease
MKPKDARDLANKLLKEFGLTDKGWTFKFDKAVTRFGYCQFKCKRISLSKKLTIKNDRGQVENTIRHEIAHALDVEDRGTSDHSSKWKSWARYAGAEPERCYSEEEVETVKPKYYHVCPNCNNAYARYKRQRKIKLQSCGECSKSSYDVRYVLIPNVSPEQLEALQEGTLDIRDTKQVARIAAHLERTLDKAAKAHHPLLQN